MTPGHLLANRQCGTRHWELWLCRCQSGKPGWNHPEKRNTTGYRWWWSGTRFQVVTWDGERICESMCEGSSWVEFLGDFGGGCVFFCQPDNLGVNDSQFDLRILFQMCFLASRFLDSKWGGANFPWLWFSGWFSNGWNGSNFQTSTLRRPNLLLVASEVSQKVQLFWLHISGCWLRTIQRTWTFLRQFLGKLRSKQKGCIQLRYIPNPSHVAKMDKSS